MLRYNSKSRFPRSLPLICSPLNARVPLRDELRTSPGLDAWCEQDSSNPFQAGETRRGRPQPGRPQPGRPQPGRPQPGEASPGTERRSSDGRSPRKPRCAARPVPDLLFRAARPQRTRRLKTTRSPACLSSFAAGTASRRGRYGSRQPNGSVPGAPACLSEPGAAAQAKSASVMPSAWPAGHWTNSIR
jgi:hypothetical protein